MRLGARAIECFEIPSCCEETQLQAKKMAHKLREHHHKMYPDAFRVIEGTRSRSPATWFLRSLVDCDISPLTIAGGPDFDFTRNSTANKRIVHPNQVSSLASKRALLLKLYHQKNYGFVPMHETREIYHSLPNDTQNELVNSILDDHTFAAEYAFGPAPEFCCVVERHGGNPFPIAEAYQFPLLYVMFQLACYGIRRSHFVSTINGITYRILGNNANLLASQPRESLLLGMLQKLPLKYHGRLIYRTTKLGNRHFLCMGVALVKRGRLRVHVFGVDRDCVADTILQSLRQVGTPLAVIYV